MNEILSKRVVYVVNPTSAAGKCDERFKLAYDFLKQNGRAGEVLRTEHSGHAEELTKKAIAQGAECVAVVGGDGTVREAGSALINTGVPMCVLPFGSGNDFSKVLGLPTDPIAAAKQLLTGSIESIDAASVNDIVFMNVAGFGFDVEVLVQTEKYKRVLGGKLAYIFGLLQALIHLKGIPVSFEHDGVLKKLNAFIVSAGNGRYIGGGMPAHPLSDISDGLLEICVIQHVKKRKVPALLMNFMKGKHLDSKDCVYFRTKEISFECGVDSIVQLDGELIGKTPCTFKILPNAIQLVR